MKEVILVENVDNSPGMLELAKLMGYKNVDNFVDIPINEDYEEVEEVNEKVEEEEEVNSAANEVVENSETEIEVDNAKEIILKDTEGINESNLMTLPFISLKRKPEKVLERTWIRDNKEVGLKVVGGEGGCPTMYDLDVLLALFRIMMKQQNNRYVLKSDKTVEFPKVIKFSFRMLAREMGLKSFNNAVKDRIEKSLRKLNEVTIYSKFSVRDHVEGKYVRKFSASESCRILRNLSTYCVEEYKFNDEKLLSPKAIIDSQSVEIDDFFYKNLCGNYFKIYDHSKYIKLKSSIAKKLFLILTQWSNGFEKFISMQTLYDYIGLDVVDKDTTYYYNGEIKKALKELVAINFIDDYKFKVNEGVSFLFNKKQKELKFGLDKYITDTEVLVRLLKIGISYDEIRKYLTSETLPYVSALLRYIDHKEEIGQIDDVYKFTVKGLPYNSYNVDKYMI